MISKRESNAIRAKEDLLNAVGVALKKHGFAKLGVNTVAAEAKMDKTAIYRYFNNFEELLEAYIASKEYWIKTLHNLSGSVSHDNLQEIAKSFLREQINALLSNEELCQLILWELGDKDGIAYPITVKREMLGENNLMQSRHVLDNCGVDFNFIYAIILGGVYYLSMRKGRYPFCEVELANKEHKAKLVNALDWLIDQLFDASTQVSEIERIAIRLVDKGLSKTEIAEITGVSLDKLDKITSYS